MKKKPLLMIPGPIEFNSDVLSAISERTLSHVSQEFIEIFGSSLEKLRQIVGSKDGQPFILTGSGTLAMDFVASNMVEPGDSVLVINTGYFGDRFTNILERYGAVTTQIRPLIGESPSLEAIQSELRARKYKFLTITQVDTSTGILVDVKSIAELARNVGTLVIVDGVCSIGAEELLMDDWGVDLVFTASQKAIGVPPGLALIMVGSKALEIIKTRESIIPNYYCDINNWLPVMEAYEKRIPSYFGTPAVNLICGLNVSLNQIISEGLEARFARHKLISRACKEGIKSLGMSQIPKDEIWAAHSMTAPIFPSGVTSLKFLSAVKQNGVILAGGLLPEKQSEYFRIGHMGSVDFNDILAVIGSIELALKQTQYSFNLGNGIQKVIDVFNSG